MGTPCGIWNMLGTMLFVALVAVKAGHSGGRPFSQIVDEDSMKLAFLSWQLGTK